MSRFFIALVLGLALQSVAWAGFKYPSSPKGTAQRCFKLLVEDPYRWLEKPNSKKTRTWVEEQRRFTENFLNMIPEREAIRKRLTELYQFEEFTVPVKVGEHYFYASKKPGQNQSVLYRSKTQELQGEVLIDPNTLSKDGTTALSAYAFEKKNGKYLAYGLSDSGSDWITWHVKDLETGKDLEDVVKWTKYGNANWANDGLGFYYMRYPEPKEGEEHSAKNSRNSVYFHRVGTSQSEDILVYERPDNEKIFIEARELPGTSFLVIEESIGTGVLTRVSIKDLSKENSTVLTLTPEFDSYYELLDYQDGRFFFYTKNHAPRGRVVSIDPENPAPEHWEEVFSESDETLEQGRIVGSKFVTLSIKNVASQIRICDLFAPVEFHYVDLPQFGSVSSFVVDKTTETAQFFFSSYAMPPTLYKLDLNSGKLEVLKRFEVPFNPDHYETQQVWYRSKDGTSVPMYVVHKKGIKLDGANPTYLTGYGGFNVSLMPEFKTTMAAWMEMGGVLAVPNLRGGGEFGEDWHLAGTRENKQNVFDDFIGAAEWLIAQKYTSTEKLAIAGGSNGGLLIGAVLNQRPDLFGAALPAVGVMDMLRFHKFTNGKAWIHEYGSADEPRDFNFLYQYSPLHNIVPGTHYPATMVTTGDHDDRVVPSHSYKYAATLQQAQAGPAPILIRIDRNAGHGKNKPTEKVIDETADKFAFLFHALRMK